MEKCFACGALFGIQIADNRKYMNALTPPESHPAVLDEFLELAVHDLDSPVRKLYLLSEQLQARSATVALPPELVPYITRMRNCAADIRALIDDLYLLAGVSVNGTRFFECELNIVAHDVVQELDGIIKEKDAVITIELLPVVSGDKRLLSLLFMHLVRNALAFSDDQRAPVITIRASVPSASEVAEWSLPVNQTWSRIDVADNGIGIDEEDRQRIMQPFVMLHGKNSHPGHNGMGLAICNKIMKVHNGILFAGSNAAQGSLFSFIIPQHQTGFNA